MHEPDLDPSPAKSSRRKTSALVNAASVMERAEEQVLPALFRPVGSALHVTPTQLGFLTFSRALTQALASPLAGMLGDRLDRRLVIGLGCVTWSLVTTLIAANTSYVLALLLWMVNGLSLAAIIPASQSLLADLYPGHERGKVFGMLYLTGAVGAMGATILATNIGSKSLGGVVAGWRVAFLAVAVVSGLVGVLVLRHVHDPTAKDKARRAMMRRLARKGGGSGMNGRRAPSPGREIKSIPPPPPPLPLPSPSSSSVAGPHRVASSERLVKEGTLSRSTPSMGNTSSPPSLSTTPHDEVSWTDIKWLLRIPTFRIIVLQGIAGASPWNALAWMTYFLQLVGMSDHEASAVTAAFLAASAVGGLLGGYLGDVAAKWSPHHGRILVAQATVAAGLPLSWLFFHSLPRDNASEAFSMYLVVAAIFGGSISWAAPACNSPVFSEIVPQRLRTSIYAYDRCLESALAACAAPLVGWAAERLYGFQGRVSGDRTATAATGHSDAAIAADQANARALGNALLLCTMVPWTICLAFYTLLHWTFHRDRAAQLARQLREVGLTSILAEEPARDFPAHL